MEKIGENKAQIVNTESTVAICQQILKNYLHFHKYFIFAYFIELLCHSNKEYKIILLSLYYLGRAPNFVSMFGENKGQCANADISGNSCCKSRPVYRCSPPSPISDPHIPLSTITRKVNKKRQTLKYSSFSQPNRQVKLWGRNEIPGIVKTVLHHLGTQGNHRQKIIKRYFYTFLITHFTLPKVLLRFANRVPTSKIRTL